MLWGESDFEDQFECEIKNIEEIMSPVDICEPDALSYVDGNYYKFSTTYTSSTSVDVLKNGEIVHTATFPSGYTLKNLGTQSIEGLSVNNDIIAWFGLLFSSDDKKIAALVYNCTSQSTEGLLTLPISDDSALSYLLGAGNKRALFNPFTSSFYITSKIGEQLRGAISYLASNGTLNFIPFDGNERVYACMINGNNFEIYTLNNKHLIAPDGTHVVESNPYNFLNYPIDVLHQNEPKTVVRIHEKYTNYITSKVFSSFPATLRSVVACTVALSGNSWDGEWFVANSSSPFKFNYINENAYINKSDGELDSSYRDILTPTDIVILQGAAYYNDQTIPVDFTTNGDSLNEPLAILYVNGIRTPLRKYNPETSQWERLDNFFGEE